MQANEIDARFYTQPSSNDDDNSSPLCRPWAREQEKDSLQYASKEPWPGNNVLFDFPPDQDGTIADERRTVMESVKIYENRLNYNTNVSTRFGTIDKAFLRWKNVGCQLCYANTGEPEPDHKLEECVAWDTSKRAQHILKWLGVLKIPRSFNGVVGRCSLCYHTTAICGDVQIGVRIGNSHHNDFKDQWKKQWLLSQEIDGLCEYKSVV